MPTSRITLDTTQYVRVNIGLNPITIEAKNGDIYVCMTENQPSINNQAFITVDNRHRHKIDHLDSNVWVYSKVAGVHAAVEEQIGGDRSIDYYTRVARGLVPGHKLVHKFGYGVVGTTPAPITSSGFWRTPTTATALEFVSDSTDDATGGIGATKIVIQGIDESWNEVTQEIATDGTTAVPITTSLLRLYRWYVSESGAYADETSASHSGTLTIRESGAGQVWDSITGATPFSSQSEVGVFTIPIGYTAFILARNIFTDTNKVADIYFLQRPFANDVTTPFSGARRLIERDVGVKGGYQVIYRSPKGTFVGPCDIGFMGKVASGTADISVDYEILLIQDGY